MKGRQESWLEVRSTLGPCKVHEWPVEAVVRPIMVLSSGYCRLGHCRPPFGRNEVFSSTLEPRPGHTLKTTITKSDNTNRKASKDLIILDLRRQLGVHGEGRLNCLATLLPEPIDAVYDLKLGRDWFNYCMTSVPDAHTLLSDDMCLVFNSSFHRSPFFAVRPPR